MPNATIQFDVIRDEVAFRSLRPEWEALYARCRPANPFLSHAWLSACWERYRASARLFVMTARRDGELVGVAPLRVERRWGLRELCFLGKGSTPYVAFLRTPEAWDLEAAFLDEIGARRDDWDLLRLAQLAEPFTLLHRTGGSASRFQLSDPCPWAGSAYVAFEGDWEALRKSGLGWLKDGHKRVSRFEREGGSVERYSGGDGAARVQEVLEVEARSWQGRYGQSHTVQERERFGTLLRSAFTAFDGGGELELWLARVAGEAVAYELNFLSPERIWLYRGAYVEQFARLSPGVVLDYLSVRRAWETGRREFDFLSGGEPYKLQRTNAVRPLMQLAASPRTLRGAVAFFLFAASRSGLNRFPHTREVLQLVSRICKSPKSLLPGHAAVASRIHH